MRITANRAATQTRNRVVAYLRRTIMEVMRGKRSTRSLELLPEIIDWVRTMDERQDRRKGGLGRKRK